MSQWFSRPFRAASLFSDRELSPEIHGRKVKIKHVPIGVVHASSGRVRGGRTPNGLVVKMNPDRRRRVMVKVSFHGRKGEGYAGRLRAHVKYLERDGAGENEQAATFFSKDRDAVDGREFAAKIQFDDRHFRLIVSPNDGEKITDMKQFVRDFMQRVEKDLGTKLEWVAVTHEKSDAAHALNRHAHIMLRGVDENREALLISRAYVSRGFRQRAEELATQRLGPLNDRELVLWKQRQHEQAEKKREEKPVRQQDREERIR